VGLLLTYLSCPFYPLYPRLILNQTDRQTRANHAILLVFTGEIDVSGKAKTG
jgi:hypothetical protein